MVNGLGPTCLRVSPGDDFDIYHSYSVWWRKKSGQVRLLGPLPTQWHAYAMLALGIKYVLETAMAPRSVARAVINALPSI
jgi:hypothetical protein